MASEPDRSRTRAGRPRSERVRLAILEAAADQLTEGGLAAANIEAVAARAGVSKVTIYRWWPSRGALAVDAYFHRYSQPISLDSTGRLAEDLATQIRLLASAFRGRAGELMAELMGHAQSDPALAERLRTGWLLPRRRATVAGLQGAIERGEIRADIDLDTVCDQLFGPLYYRLSMRHAPLEDDLPERIVAVVLDGIRPPSSQG